MIGRMLLWLSPALLAGACAAGQCDPGNAGFFSGIGCAAGSGYTQRTTDLQNTSAAAQGMASQSEASAAYEERSATAAQAETARLRKQVADMQRGQASLRRQLAAAQVRRGAQDAAVQQAQAHLSALDQQLHAAQAGPAPDAAQLQRLNAQRQAVLAELGAL